MDVRACPIHAHGGAALIPRQHVVLSPGGGGIQKLQAANRQGPAHADDSLQHRSSHRMRQFRKPAARPWHFKTRGTSRAHGARRSARQDHAPDPHPKRLLSLMGGAAGLAVAYAFSRMILLLAFPHAHQYAGPASPSLTVLGFAFLVSLLTGIVFGTVPAWYSSQAKAAEAFRTAARSTGERSLVSAESAGRYAGGIVDRIALGSVSDGSLACQPRASEFRHRHSQSLCAPHRSGRGGLHLNVSPHSIARLKTVSPRCPPRKM